MCTTCGCSDATHTTVTNMQSGERIAIDDHEHAHHHHEHDDHHHDHRAGHTHPPLRAHQHPTTGHRHDQRVVALDEAILAKNDMLAARNRGWLEGRNILAVNLVSSPGAGKTTLLERTLRDLQGELVMSVIEGDQATTRDAERIRAAGCAAVQVNTGAGCHLDAEMVARALQTLAPPTDSVVMIENVGNLVCPALFDLGEYDKVVVASVTEGEDKPLKYPHMFKASRLLLLNKVDLLPHVRFDVDQFCAHARSVHPGIEVLRVSATTGEGLDRWYEWLRAARARAN